MRNILCGLAFLAGIGTLHAQQSNDLKRHEVSLQANQLLRQILSFGNNQSVNNPYLLRYTYYLNEDYLLTAGFGLNIDNENEKEAGKTSFSNLNLRLGIMRNLDLGKGFELGLGFDLAARRQQSHTKTISTTGFSGFADSSVAQTKSLDNFWGFGPRIKFNYHITSNLLIGTEANYYFLKELQRIDVSTENFQFNSNGVVRTSSSDSRETRGTSFDVQVPVAIYLILRF